MVLSRKICMEEKWCKMAVKIIRSANVQDTILGSNFSVVFTEASYFSEADRLFHGPVR